MNDMIETPVALGEEGGLVGIVTKPGSATAAPLACLLLPLGAGNRVGPNRINVKIARALAAQGITSLRLDPSGLGDSRSARSQANFLGQVVLDMQAAMDHLQASTGIERFAIAGMCSGAASGYAASLADPRVVGLMMFDGFGYPSKAANRQHSFERFLRDPRGRVLHKINQMAERLRRRPQPEPAGLFAADSATPAPAEFERAMDQLIARGVSVYLAYSGSLRVSDRNRAQLSAFGKAPFVQRVRYEFMADVDHAVMPLAAQHKFTAAVCGWASDIAGTERFTQHDAPTRREAGVQSGAPVTA